MLMKIAPLRLLAGILCAAATTLLPSASKGQEVEWIRQFGTDGGDSANGVALDARGYPHVAGRVGGGLPGQTSAGEQDAFVRKYDPSGGIVWTRQFGSVDGTNARGLALDAAGNVYVAGSVNGALPGQVSMGLTDAFVRAYDANGDELWTRQFGTQDYDLGREITVGPDGSVVVAGHVGRGAGDDPGGGALPGQASAGGADAFARKYDRDGDEIWTVQFGTAERDDVDGVAVDAAGNVIVAGDTRGTLPGQVRVAVDPSFSDAYVRKLDGDGNELWTRQFGVPEGAHASAVAVDAEGAILVVGSVGIEGVLPGQTSSGHSDAYVRAYNAGGDELWTHQFGTPSYDWASGVAVDAPAGVLVGGAVNGALPDQVHVGNQDAYIRLYDAEGGERWTLQFGGDGSDRPGHLDVDAEGSVYLSGHTWGTLPGQIPAGGFTDAFLAKAVPPCTALPAAVALPPTVCAGEDALLDASASLLRRCAGEIEYGWTSSPVPPPPGALCGPTPSLDCWGDDPTLPLTDLAPPPGESTVTRWLWIRCRDDLDCTNDAPFPVAVEVQPDPIPPPTGNGFWLEREDDAILFRWTPLPGDVGGYEVLGLDGDAGPPTPAAFEAAPAPLAAAGAPESEVTVLGAAVSPPRLVFFKLRATSPCTGTPGPACDGFPAQVPCP